MSWQMSVAGFCWFELFERLMTCVVGICALSGSGKIFPGAPQKTKLRLIEANPCQKCWKLMLKPHLMYTLSTSQSVVSVSCAGLIWLINPAHSGAQSGCHTVNLYMHDTMLPV